MDTTQSTAERERPIITMNKSVNLPLDDDLMSDCIINF